MAGLCACTLLISSELHAADGLAEASASNTPVELFRSFIASPPIIDELYFDLKVRPPGAKWSSDYDLSHSTNFQGFLARWQPNARSIYHVFPTSVSTNPVMNWFSGSLFEKKHWHLSPNGELLFWYDNGAALPPEAEQNFIKTGIDYLTYRLAELLNMGVFNVDIGGIRWHGNSFVATNSQFRLRFEGALNATADGFPSHLRLRCHTATNSNEYTVYYSFDRNIGVPYLPNQIRSVQNVNGKLREVLMIKIKSIKFGDQYAGETEFLPRTNLLALPVRLRYFTNGAYYAFDKRGRLVSSPLGANRHRNAEPNRRIYLIVCAAMSLAIFALTVRAKAKGNQNQNRLPPEPRKETA